LVDPVIAKWPSATGAVETRTQRRWRGVHSSLTEAVHELVVEYGDESFSVTDIAARADVAPGTFYNHFDGKDDAIDAAMLCDFAVLMDGIRATAAGDLSALERWAVTSGVIVHRVIHDGSWSRFAVVVYRPPRWPTDSVPNPTPTVIEAGLAEGTMKVHDVKLAYHLNHHLHLGLADVADLRPPLPLSTVALTILKGQAAVLGIDPDLVPPLAEWVLPRLEKLTWP